MQILSVTQAPTVVGYQQKAIDTGFNWWCNTFVPCDKTADTITIQSIVPEDPNVFSFSTIDFVDETGATVVLQDPELGEIPASYAYWDAEIAPAGVSGWYPCDDDGSNPRNDVQIKLGEAYIVSCYDGEEGARLVYSGAVYDQSRTFEIESGFNWLGNCAPKDITIKDITVDSSVFSFSTIDFVDETGATIVLQDPELGEIPASYAYWDAEIAPAGVAGWYPCDDDGSNPRNDVEIKAGDAFIVSCYDGEEGAAITFPSAL